MKVTTKYPVYIDKKQVSNGDFYMNADAQERIFTKYPVYINGKKISSGDLYMAFDGDGKPTNSAETKIFQDWLDVKYPTWVNGGKLNKGQGYGKYPFGPSTETAWKNYGTAFVNEAKALAATVSQTLAVTPGKEPTEQQKADAAKKGIKWDKVKGWLSTAAQAGQQSGLFDSILNRFGITPPAGAPVGTDPMINTNTTTTTTTPTEEELKKKKRTRNMIIIGAVGVVVIIAVVMLMKSKPAPAPTTPTK